MVTTKKIATEYIEKEMRSKFKCLTIKNLNTKADSNARNEGQKSCRAYRKKIAK